MDCKKIIPWMFLSGLITAAYFVSTPSDEKPTPKTRKQEIIALDDSNIQAHSNIAIHFYAPGCPVCASVHKTIETVAKDYTTPAFGEVNITEHPPLAELSSIIHHPTIVFIKDNKEVKRTTGLVTPRELEEIIEWHYDAQ